MQNSIISEDVRVDSSYNNGLKRNSFTDNNIILEFDDDNKIRRKTFPNQNNNKYQAVIIENNNHKSSSSSFSLSSIKSSKYEERDFDDGFFVDEKYEEGIEGNINNNIKNRYLKLKGKLTGRNKNKIQGVLGRKVLLLLFIYYLFYLRDGQLEKMKNLRKVS
jgi:hypothetical protein